MTTNKLLEKALAQNVSKGLQKSIPITYDEVEMCIELLKGNITARGYAKAINIAQPGSVYQRIPGVLRWGITQGVLDIKLK